jgi:hypothetical protein
MADLALKATRTSRRLISNRELERTVATIRKLGVPIGAIDIRADGVTIYPPDKSPETDFDRWQQKNKNCDRVTSR